MIANNIFRALGDFCTEVLFLPYDFFRFMDGWWQSNIVNSVFVLIAFLAGFYWLSQMIKHHKQNTL